MADDHSKLIAKIQHFYDLLNTRLNLTEDDSFVTKNELDKTCLKEKIIELQGLLAEYNRIFEKVLYHERII